MRKKFVGQSFSGRKKKWLTPILTVLVRGRNRQEGVLRTCKSAPIPPGGSASADDGCIVSHWHGPPGTGEGGPCGGPCMTVANS